MTLFGTLLVLLEGFVVIVGSLYDPDAVVIVGGIGVGVLEQFGGVCCVF